jgi:putative transposase
LKGYDYAQLGAYFITVVTRQRICPFGSVIDGEIILNEAGQIVQRVWNELPDHFSGTDIDAFAVMPNHIHGIIHISERTEPVGAQHAAPLPVTAK